MNDERREEIRRVLTLIEEAKRILEGVLDQQQDDFDNMPRTSKTMKRDKERRRWLTRWSRLQRVVMTQFPPARRCCGTSANNADAKTIRSARMAAALPD